MSEALDINADFNCKQLKFVGLDIVQIGQIRESLRAEFSGEALLWQGLAILVVSHDLVLTSIDFSVHIPEPLVDLRDLETQLVGQVVDGLLAGRAPIQLTVELPKRHLLADGLAVLPIAFLILRN